MKDRDLFRVIQELFKNIALLVFHLVNPSSPFFFFEDINDFRDKLNGIEKRGRVKIMARAFRLEMMANFQGKLQHS